MAPEREEEPRLPWWSWTACGVLLAPACLIASFLEGPSGIRTALLAGGVGLAVVTVAAQVIETWRLGGNSR